MSVSVTENILEDVDLHSDDEATTDGNDEDDETTNSKWATVRNEVVINQCSYITCFRNSMCETQ